MIGLPPLTIALYLDIYKTPPGAHSFPKIFKILNKSRFLLAIETSLKSGLYKTDCVHIQVRRDHVEGDPIPAPE